MKAAVILRSDFSARGVAAVWILSAASASFFGCGSGDPGFAIAARAEKLGNDRLRTVRARKAAPISECVDSFAIQTHWSGTMPRPSSAT